MSSSEAVAVIQTRKEEDLSVEFRMETGNRLGDIYIFNLF